MVFSHSVDGPVYRMTVDQADLGDGRHYAVVKPISNLFVFHDDGHPVVNLLAISVCSLGQQHTGFHVLVTVGPLVP